MSENQTFAPTVTRTHAQKLRAKYDTIVARITKDNEAALAIAEEIASIAALAAIDVGSAVVIKLGRKFADKDTTRFENATIIGVKEEEDGSKLFKVQYGTGFDADVAVVTGASLSLPAAPSAE